MLRAKTAKKPLRLFDLGELRRQRKAFEGGRENGVGVGNAPCRLIKFSQRERGAQLEAPRFLLLRDGDCGEQCILGRRRIRRIALEQNLAAAAMQESVAPAFSCLGRES
jgi:hypothetical protein